MSKTQISTRLRVGDEVLVISGKNKKSKGEILIIDKEKGRVIVKGVNLRKRFVRPTQENPKGRIVEIENPISISNVMYFDPKLKKGTRIRFDFKEGKKVRVGVSSGKQIS